jgi:hypothetical protein
MIPDYESSERGSDLFGRAIRHSGGTNVPRAAFQAGEICSERVLHPRERKIDDRRV